MGQKELLASLRRKGEEDIARFKEEAEREAARIEKELAERLREKKRLFDSERKAERDLLSRMAILEAERKKRACRTKAKGELAERLASLARKMLPVFREHGYEALFARLVGEISVHGVEQVAVNPADEKLAGRFFPRAAIVTDPSITGGLKATGGGGGLAIDNTFEKRLQRAWRELLPQLVKEVEKEMV